MDTKLGLTGLILAGGRGSRMDGWDKGLLEVAGRPLVERVIHSLAPQVDQVIISTPRHLDQYRRFRCPVVEDLPGVGDGPLAGVAAGLERAATDFVLVVPGDAAQLPPDLAARLWRHRGDADIARADDGDTPAFHCWLLPRLLRGNLRAFLAEGGRDPAQWLARHRVRRVDFSDWPAQCWRLKTWQDLAGVEPYLRALEARPFYSARFSA